MRAETNALSAHLSHVSYREPWLRDVEGIKEWITVRRRGRENVSEAFQRPRFPHYLSFRLYVCLPIRYFYQSAVGSWNTEASLFASANQMQRGGGREGGRRKHLRAEKNKRVRKMRRGSSDGWGGSEWESRICTPDIFGILNEAFGSTDTLTIWSIFQCTAVIFPSQHQCRHETHRSPDRASEQTAVLTTTFSDRTARSQWTEAAFLFKLACLVSCQCVLF